MKFWNEMPEKQTPLDTDILMVGDSADTQQPKHTTFASLMSWVKTKLGHTTITPGNIPVLATDGTLADSGQRPVKICDSYGNPREAHVVNDPNRGVVVVIEAKNPATGDYYSCDSGDVLRFWMPMVTDLDGTKNVAIKYQDTKICVRFKDYVKNETYIKLLQAQNGDGNFYRMIYVRDVYGAIFDVQLGRGGDGFLYSIVLGNVKGSELFTQAAPIPDTNITLNATTSTYTVSANTGATVGITAQTDGCSVQLPTTLTADQAVTFVIADSSKAISIGGTTYQAGDTVFCVFDYDTDADTGEWTVNNTIQPTITDYSDVNVKFVLDNTNFKSYSCVRTTADEYQVRFSTVTKPLTKSMIGQLVAVIENIEYASAGANDTLKNTWRIKPGLYYVSGAKGDVANAETGNYKLNIKKLADIDSLSLVTAANENKLTREGIWKVVKSTAATGSWFEKLSDKADAATVNAQIAALNTTLATKADLVSGKIPVAQLPSYVDDVQEGYYYNNKFYSDAAHTTELTGTTGKIYVNLTNNSSYRYAGTVYVRIDEIDLATTTTAGLLSATDKTKLDTLDATQLVHTTGTETISGAKTFTSTLTSSSFVVANGTSDQFLKADGTLDASIYLKTNGILPVANGGTGTSTPNFVDLTTNQTIAGAKTFTSNITAANLSGTNTGDETTATILTKIGDGTHISAQYLSDNTKDVINLLNVTGIAPTSPAEADKYYDPATLQIKTYTAAAWVSTTPETAKIYIDTLSNQLWRWSGTAMINITDSNQAMHLAGAETATGMKTFANGLKTDLIRGVGGQNLAAISTDGSTQYYGYKGKSILASDDTATTLGVAGSMILRLQETKITANKPLQLTNASVYAQSFVVDGGTTSQFLKADGTLDSTAYISNLSANAVGTLPIINGGTGSTSKNFVDLTTNQTVAGVKTFTSTITATNLSGNNTGDETTTTILTKIGDGNQIAAQYLPSYVDDVVELLNITGTVPATPVEADKYFDPTTSKIQTYTSSAWVATTPEAGKIYVSTDTNYQYRWTGTALIHINVTDLSYYVDLTTAQTITGIKTFRGTTYMSSLYGVGTILSTIISPNNDGGGSVGGAGGWWGNGYFNNINIKSLNIPTLTTAGIVTNTAAGVLGTVATIPIENGGTNATTAATARTNLGAAASGANSDITSLTGLTTPLSVTQGGTGSAVQNFVDLTTNQTIAGAKTFILEIGTGSKGSKFGYRAANSSSSSTIGQFAAVGNYAAYNATGYNFTALGNKAGYMNLDAHDWVAIGASAGYGNLNGTWVAVGTSAGARLANNSYATNYSASTYIGHDTRVSADGVVNENVFGHVATGAGSNTVSLGNTDCTGLYFAGNKFLDNNRNATLNTITSTALTTAGIVTNTAAGVLGTVATVPIENGGTNATTVAAARTNLGAAASGANADITSLTGLTTPLSVTQGGTGSTVQNFVDLTTDQTIAGAKTFTSGISCPIGKNNERFGNNAGINIANSHGCTFVGSGAGQFTTNTSNSTAVGYWAALANTSGAQFTAIGSSAGQRNVTGIMWTAVGCIAARDNTSGDSWVAVGNSAAIGNATGTGWIAIGTSAGTILNPTATSKYDKSVYVGAGTTCSLDGVTNENVFGHAATGAGSNTVSLGNSDCTGLYFAGNKFLDNNRNATLNTITSSALTTAGIVTNTAAGVLGTVATIPIENGGTNATTAATARTNLGAAASGANSDITSLTGLTTPLSVTQGGTGSTVQNFVDLTTNQNIAGAKTFTSTITATNLSGNNTGDETTTTILTKIGDGNQIAAQYLPSYVDDVVELLNITGTVPTTPAEADKYFDPATSKIQTYTSSAWVATTPEAGKIYVSTDTNNQYRWSGSGMIQITNTIDFATQAEAEVASPTENTKIATLLRVFQGFKYWLQNTAISTLTTTAQTIVGAINELKSTKANAGANSDITSLSGLTTPLDVTEGGTGSATKNFVDLTTDQNNIAGVKNFTGQIKTGTAGIRIGSWAATNTTTAVSYVAVGDHTGTQITTASNWLAVGSYAAFNMGNFDGFTAIGPYAASQSVSGSDWIAIGHRAACDSTGNTGAYRNFSNSVYVGARTVISSDFVTNENVFGYAANGAGSNTVSLGNSACTGLYFAGNKFLDNNRNATLSTTTVTQLSQTIQTLTDATTIVWNAALGANALLTLTDAVTTRTISNITNLVAGTTYQIFITQSPNATYPAVGWDTLYKFPSSITPNLNSAAGGVTCLEFFYTGTSLRLKNVIAY